MLDVHAPENGIHGVRDFFLHLLTITIGLLIALLLENAAEKYHHHRDRNEAEKAIRQEIAANRDGILASEAQFKTELTGMQAVLLALQQLSEGQPGQLREEYFIFHQGTMQDSAWRTASSTGVLQYMDYAHVQGFSDAYKEQDQLDAMERQTLDDYLELMPVLAVHGGKVSAEQAKEALPYAQRAVAHLHGMAAIGVGTLESYDAALK